MISLNPSKYEASDNQIFPELAAQFKLKTQSPRIDRCRLWGQKIDASLSHLIILFLLSRETPSPVHPLNAGAPSSKLSAEDRTTDPTPTGRDEGGGTDLQAADSQPQETLTH